MASPSTRIQRTERSPEETARQSLQQIADEAVKNSSALKSLLYFAGELENSGLLAMLTAFIAAKDQVLGVALEQVSKPGSTNAIQNLMKLAQTLARVDGSYVENLLGAVVKGVEKGHEQLESSPEVGVFDLVRALRDPDINRALVLILGVLKGVGESLGQSGVAGNGTNG